MSKKSPQTATKSTEIRPKKPKIRSFWPKRPQAVPKSPKKRSYPPHLNLGRTCGALLWHSATECAELRLLLKPSILLWLNQCSDVHCLRISTFLFPSRGHRTPIKKIKSLHRLF